MPLFIPRFRSGEHRIAAIALYRALLSQCRALPLATQQVGELQNIIRNRVKQARRSQSTRLLRVSFEAGYQALDHLDAANAGDEASTTYIRDILDRAPPKLKLPPPVKQQALRPRNSGDVEDKPSILDRPLPLFELTGKRHVPVLFNANRIPVLRIKKPQPANLSGYIYNRIEQRQKRQDRRWELDAEKTIAAHEDEWDALVNKQQVQGEKIRWVDAVQMAAVEVQASLDLEKDKNRRMAERMQIVVDRERQLLEEESTGKR